MERNKRHAKIPPSDTAELAKTPANDEDPDASIPCQFHLANPVSREKYDEYFIVASEINLFKMPATREKSDITITKFIDQRGGVQPKDFPSPSAWVILDGGGFSRTGNGYQGSKGWIVVTWENRKVTKMKFRIWFTETGLE